MKNYLEFVKNKNIIESKQSNGSKIKKYIETVNKILKKHIKNMFILDGIDLVENDKELFSSQYIVDNGKLSFTINWDKDKLSPYSIHFFDKEQTYNLLWNDKAKSNLSLYTLGSSIVYFLPIIWTVINSNNLNISKSEAIKIGRSVYDEKFESYIYNIGNLRYYIYENLNYNIIDTTFNFVNEAASASVEKYRDEKRKVALNKFANRQKSPENKAEYDKAWKEYEEIKDAIDNGASTLKELKLALKHNVDVYLELSGLIETEVEQNSKRESPAMVFKKMAKYISMVIKGINPSLILCGAPGVGKTYKVKTQLKANGYVEGENLLTIKGKCSPRILYTSLYQYKDKGQIIVIDDADSLVGPKAPEDCINILKGALDSTSDAEGRLVSYGVAGKITDDEGEQLPKRFHYNGSIIIITNYNAGSLDTALRGRSYIQDIKFTTEEVLEIIESLISKLEDSNLSTKAKIKAFDYLVELSKTDNDMEISIRTFIICAKIFEACLNDEDFTDDDAKSMIKEQMKLQSDRIKNKY